MARFTDNDDGTVTDNRTGLVWLKNANATGEILWSEAINYCKKLSHGIAGLTDGSVAGDWRVSSRLEIKSLLDANFFNPAICNTKGNKQWTEGDPFTGVTSNYYWNCSTSAYCIGYVFADAYEDLGHMDKANNTYTYYVWPVKGIRKEAE